MVEQKNFSYQGFSSQGNTFGFEGVILDALREIHKLAYYTFSSENEAKLLGFEASIRVFHAYLSPYYDRIYKEKVFGYTNSNGEKVKGIKKRLSELGGRDESNKLDLIEEWLIEIVKRFGRIGILPAIDTEEVVETDTQKEWTERERILKKALALVKENGAGLQELLEDSTVEQIMLKKEKDFYLKEMPERWEKIRVERRLKVNERQ